MKKTLLLNVTLLLNIFAFAQSKVDPSRYGQMINSFGLKRHLSIIASDAMEGRETGTPGQQNAAAYIEQHFRNIGLRPSLELHNYQQFYPLCQDSLISASLNIGGDEISFGKEAVSPIKSNETKSFKSNNIVFVGYGIEDTEYSDYNKVNAKGKVVCFFTGEPKKNGTYFINKQGGASNWDLTTKLEKAASKGAVGAFVIELSKKTFDRTLQYNPPAKNQKSALYYPEIASNEKKINYVLVSDAIGKKILGSDFEKLAASSNANSFLNDATKEINTLVSYAFEKQTDTIKASNVIGIVEGSDKKDEYVFLTAHYDHLGIKDGKIYNGADDDGSGTVTVLQMAEAFAKAKQDGNGPRRTVVFMTVSGEEKGLWGSEYYSENPVFPLDKTSVDLNTDMIGRVDTERKTSDSLNYVYVVGHNKISTELPIINEGVNNKRTQLVLDYRFDDPNDPNKIYYRSDHYNFARKGVPVLFFYDGMLQADYHKPTDDIEFINWPLFEKRARMIFYTAWEMANRDEMLKRDKPL